MATDIAPELYDKIQKLYRSGTSMNPVIRQIRKMQKVDFKNSLHFAKATGEEASKAFLKTLTEEVLPEGKMYYNIAERTVRPILEEVFTDVSGVCVDAQAALNADYGIGIKPIKSGVNTDRIDGIIERLTEAERLDDIKWILDAPIVNFSQSVVDTFIRDNVEFQRAAGIEHVFTRTMVGSETCDWCREKAGKYVGYDNLPDGFWQRHNGCDCEILDRPMSGKVKSVWGSQVGQLTRKTQKRLEKEAKAKR